MPAVGRDPTPAACHTSRIIKGRARRTKRGRQGSEARRDVGLPARRSFGRMRPRAAPLARQIVHRLLISFPALLGVLFLCFCLLQVVPADPAMIIAGPDAKAETIAAIRLELGLDRPIPVQFLDYILRVLRGDLGRSIISNKMVIEELGLTIGPTVELMLGAMIMAIPIGLTLGTLAAVNRGRITDRIIMAFSVA